MEKKGLRVYITLIFIITSLVPVFIFSGLQIKQINDLVLYQEDAQLQLTRTLADEINNYIGYHRKALESVASEITQYNNLNNYSQLVSLLRSTRQNFDGFENLYIGDKNGASIAFYPERNAQGQTLVGLDFSDRDYYKEVLSTHKTTMSSLFQGRGGTFNPLVVIVTPIFDQHGEFNGYVSGAINLSEIGKLVSKYNFGTGGYAVVVDGTGKVIYHPDNFVIKNNNDFSQNNVFQYILSHGGASQGKFYSSDRNEFTTYMTLPKPVPGWSVWVNSPKAVLQQPMYATIWQTSFFLLLGLILTFALGRKMAKRFTDPIEVLVQYTYKLGDTDLEVEDLPPLPVHTPRELGLLAQKLIDMAKQLQKNQQELRQLNAALEKKVEERTSRLLLRNQELIAMNSLLTVIGDRQEISSRFNTILQELLSFMPIRSISVEEYQEDLVHKTNHPNSFVQPIYSNNDLILGYLRIEFTQTVDEERIEYLQNLAKFIGVIWDNQILLSMVERQYVMMVTLLESMSDGIIITDNMDQILYTNQRTQEFTGLSKEEICNYSGTNLFALLQAHFLIQDQQDVKNIARFIIEGKEEVPRYLQINSFSVLDENKDPKGHGIILRDITKDYEVEKLKDSLLAIAAHEFRTPITSIRASLETLLRKNVTWEEGFQQELLEGMHEDILVIQDLINSWLDVTRIESGTLQLNREYITIQELRIDVQKISLKQDIELGWEPIQEPSFPLLYIDRMSMEQVFKNLLMNALRYKKPDLPVKVLIAAEYDSENIMISIRDNGIGISDKHVGNIFNRFYRADISSIRQNNGVGLGLAICKGIIEAHQGKIEVQSIEGVGTEFKLILPCRSLEEEDGFEEEQNPDC